jgi:hypothetical protein
MAFATCSGVCSVLSWRTRRSLDIAGVNRPPYQELMADLTFCCIFFDILGSRRASLACLQAALVNSLRGETFKNQGRVLQEKL